MLQLPKRLVQENARVVLTQLLQALDAEGANQVTVDAGGLAQFDSTALAVLLALRRAAQGCDRSFHLQAMPERLTKLARLYGISELLSADVLGAAGLAPSAR